MRKQYLFLPVLAVLFLTLSFNSIDDTAKYLKNTSPENRVMYEKEFLKNIDNEELNSLISKNFIRFFDRVDFIHAQFSDEIGYYYLAFGIKNDKYKTQELLVTKSDIDNELYTYIDFSDIKVSEDTEYCTKGTMCECQHEVGCRALCGVYTGTQCLSTQ